MKVMDYKNTYVFSQHFANDLRVSTELEVFYELSSFLCDFKSAAAAASLGRFQEVQVLRL